MSGTLLHDAFAATAERSADRFAAGFDQATLTFAELAARADALAGSLRDLGIRRGDRVAVLADHCSEAVVAFWATLQAGGIAVCMNERLAPEALAEIARDCEPGLLLASRWHANRLSKLPAGALPAPVVVFDDEDASSPLWRCDGGGYRSAGVSDRDIAAIVYTSGSTGQPKGVCLSHRNLHTMASELIQYMRITPADSYLMVVPLHYVHGLMQLLVHHLCGACIHFAGGVRFPSLVVRQLAETRVTGFSGVPYHFTVLMDRGGFLEAKLPDLRWVTVTGGKFPPERIAQLRKAKPALECYIGYGQTECAPRITTLDPSKVDRKPNSVGAPTPGVRVLVLDEAGCELPRGEIGEVVVRGDTVMVGYWRQPEATARVIDAQGRLHTGDLGWFDEEGDLHLVGRRDALIKSAGERIAAEEIEAVLLECDGVAEAAVCGVPDAVYGQRIEAHVRLQRQPAGTAETEAEIQRLRDHCLRRLPFARAPRAYHTWCDLPRKANGKVDRQRLLTMTRPSEESAR